MAPNAVRERGRAPIRRRRAGHTCFPVTPAFDTDALLALAARLRLWALGWLCWWADLTGDRDMRRRLRAELMCAERGARSIAVLLALRRLECPPLSGPSGRARPLSAPNGFRRCAVRGSDFRGATRRLLRSRHRTLRGRLRALDAFLRAIEAHAERLCARLERLPPLSRLMVIAAGVARLRDPGCTPPSRDTS